MKAALTLAALLGALAGSPTVAAPPPDPGVLPAGAAPGFAQAETARVFVFPRDHGPHPEFRQEWWYLTGNLDGPRGERFGFEMTFFRFALSPPAALPSDSGAGPATGGASAWRTREIYLAHFAITDVAAKRFRSAQKLARGALGLAGAEAEPLHVWIDDWTLGTAGAAGAVGAGGAGGAGAPRGVAAGDWKLAAAQPGYALELELHPLTPPVLNGEAGLSRKSGAPGSASYYYSVPRVAVHGRLTRAGQPLAVQGLAWFDREWGSGGLGPDEAGWDWFALQLDDGTALMFYALRDRDGSRDPHSAGTWVDSSGAATALASTAVDIDVTAHWRSIDGTNYPAAWRVRIPSLTLDVAVRPVLADQELKVSPRYFEGAVDVHGTRAGRALGGRGYVELVGYDRGP